MVEVWRRRHRGLIVEASPNRLAVRACQSSVLNACPQADGLSQHLLLQWTHQPVDELDPVRGVVDRFGTERRPEHHTAFALSPEAARKVRSARDGNPARNARLTLDGATSR